jgi:pimeloyl-ACP methyl ester carboxylesterase
MSHSTTSRRQNAKNGARLATVDASPANRSKKPIRLDTSVGISTACRFAAHSGSSWPYGFVEFIAPVYPDRRLDHVPRLLATLPPMPAVLVHGVPDTPALWDRVRAHLARDDVIAVSLPGFANPRPPGFDATKDTYAAWLVERIEQIGAPVDLVGHDWGSLLAQRVASVRPDLIRTLAFGSGPVDDAYTWHDMAQLWQTPGVGEEIMTAMRHPTRCASRWPSRWTPRRPSRWRHTSTRR